MDPASQEVATIVIHYRVNLDHIEELNRWQGEVA